MAVVAMVRTAREVLVALEAQQRARLALLPRATAAAVVVVVLAARLLATAATAVVVTS